MKITTLSRVAPDDSHSQEAALFGGDDDFELSTIRPEDTSIAMEMLIGNYASPIEAVIRELYVNASDSHRSAGVSAPVEITMPTEEAPFLVVRDQGLGMSADEMVEVFTRPAASTKRSENTSVGGLGIGAKSPFTVADRFLVEGTKNGTTATLVMARIDGRLMHRVRDISPASADAVDGVTITVPVEASTVEAWWAALSRVHFWWNPSEVLVTNAEDSPVALPSWTERLLDGGEAPAAPAVMYHRTMATSTVLMGQIAYSIPKSITPLEEALLYIVPVGELSVAPNRESIVATKENRDHLAELTRAWQDEQFAALTEKILDPSTSYIALARIRFDLYERDLLPHFYHWVDRYLDERGWRGTRTRFSGITVGMMENFEMKMKVHGIREVAAAQEISTWHLVNGPSMLLVQNCVFVDSRTLPEARRRILTKWARQNDVLAIVVDRERLESWLLSKHWGYSDSWHENPENYTRPFAYDGEIEWVDPDDIRVERKARPKPAPVAITGASPVEVMDLTSYRNNSSTWTVNDLVAHVKQSRKRVVIIDRLSEIQKIGTRLPSDILAVASGQRASSLLREKLGARAVDVMSFKAKQREYVERALTAAQKRDIADALIAKQSRIAQLFSRGAKWIDETEDPKVRAIASKIARVVHEHDHRVGPKRYESAASLYTDALKSLTGDRDWIMKHSSLGEYEPALIAATAQGLVNNWQDLDAIVGHIRATIATQLVTS